MYPDPLTAYYNAVLRAMTLALNAAYEKRLRRELARWEDDGGAVQ